MSEGSRDTSAAQPLLSFLVTVEDSTIAGDAEDELSSLLTSFVTLLPVEDASASSLGEPFDVEILAATGMRAAARDEAQIDLGEGPAWDAYRSGFPVRMQLDSPEDRGRWPFLAASPVLATVRTVHALPLRFGPLAIGAVSLYGGEPTALASDQLQLAEGLTTLIGRSVVARALAEAESGTAVRDPALSRREVHQATGMVISQTGSTAADALLAIRAHAFSTGMSVREVAAEIIARRLDLSPGPDSTDRK